MKLVVPLAPKWVRWLGVVVVAGFLFYTSIITVPPEIGVNEDVFGLLADLIGFAQDKWQHFVAYGLYTTPRPGLGVRTRIRE